jgi:hypothetical protein
MLKSVEVKLNNETFDVNIFSVADIHRVGELIYRSRRDNLISDLVALEVSDDEKFKQVSELRGKWSNGLEVLRSAYSMDGAQIICDEALGELVEIEECTDLQELVTAATLICGLPNPFEVTSDSKEEKETVDDSEEIKPDDQ